MPNEVHSLPVVSSPAVQRLPSTRRSLCVHGARWLMIALLVATLRYANHQRRSFDRSQPVHFAALPPEDLSNWFGDQATSQALDASSGERLVRGEDGQLRGRLLVTLPQSADISGYRGPSNVLIGMDTQRRILHARLLGSQDTVDHVQAIKQSPWFFQQFSGRDRDAVFQELDVVSGATLTSLAIRDSIAARLGAAVPVSTRFPEPLELADARSLFPDAARLESASGQSRTGQSRSGQSRSGQSRSGQSRSGQAPSKDLGMTSVRGEDGRVLGMLTRSGIWEDHINGYQGPTELLLAFDGNDQLRDVKVRKSFDNQPYVSYVDDEPWFWDPFRGLTWQQLAAADLRALKVEGVSGATMTSVAAAETLVAAARQQQQAQRAAMQPSQRSTLRWSPKEFATLAILCGAILWMKFSPRHARTLRGAWQWVLVIGLGLLTGNLLSVALLMGWSSSGIAWRLAPGLAAVLGATLWLAATSKSPFYCARVCPHGALQQQIRGVLPDRWRWHPGSRVSVWLQRVPVVLLVAAYWLTLTASDINLARWEPFDAYLWWTGAGGSLLLAIGSIVLSLFSPMGYCRFGCPTGNLLSYLRWHRRAGIWTRGDWITVGVWIASWVWLAHKNSG